METSIFRRSKAANSIVSCWIWLRFDLIQALMYVLVTCNRCYPENTNFETIISSNLKFHTSGEFNTTKKCRKFQLDILRSLEVIATRKYIKHIARC